MGCPEPTYRDYFFLTQYVSAVEAQPKSADRRNDGCMLTNGDWTYTWNAENRLTEAETNVGASPRWRITFSYDFMGRRVEKKTYSGTPGSWTLQSHSKFVYDGYLQIEELDALDADSISKAYVWEPGGQRLLSSVSSPSSSPTVLYVLSDANKNLTELLDDTGTVRAHYEYSPFGKITAMTGDKAADNPFRFSSEYHDDETALVYYNYRYYSPELGRWLSRDPVGEKAIYSLFLFCYNSHNRWDYLGNESRPKRKEEEGSVDDSVMIPVTPNPRIDLGGKYIIKRGGKPVSVTPLAKYEPMPPPEQAYPGAVAGGADLAAKTYKGWSSAFYYKKARDECDDYNPRGRWGCCCCRIKLTGFMSAIGLVVIQGEGFLYRKPCKELPPLPPHLVSPGTRIQEFDVDILCCKPST